MKGRTAELFLQHVIETWEKTRPGQQRPASSLVDLFQEYGRVVHDEEALRTARLFPQGESLVHFSLGDMQKLLRDVSAERALRDLDKRASRMASFYDAMMENTDGEERQYWEQERQNHWFFLQKGFFEEHGGASAEPGDGEACEAAAESEPPYESYLDRLHKLGGPQGNFRLY